MEKEKVLQQREKFKTKHGEFPAFPIRTQYKFAGTTCIGKIDLSVSGIMLFGVPGLISPLDDDIKELQMLEDGLGRKF